MTDYAAWRIKFQSADQAAHAAYTEMQSLRAQLSIERSEVTRLRMYAPGGREPHKIAMAPHVGPTNWSAWGIKPDNNLEDQS